MTDRRTWYNVCGSGTPTRCYCGRMDPRHNSPRLCITLPRDLLALVDKYRATRPDFAGRPMPRSTALAYLIATHPAFADRDAKRKRREHSST